jgi:hypothetical protein
MLSAIADAEGVRLYYRPPVWLKGLEGIDVLVKPDIKNEEPDEPEPVQLLLPFWRKPP